MDSGNGFANYKLEAIRKAIADGTLTKEEISKRLTDVIHTENEKQPDERDTDFVMACQTILYEMHTGHPYASRKEESKRELKNRFKNEEQQSTTSSPVIMRSLLVASVLMVVLFGVEILFNREWLSGNSTQDEQQYIISGQTIDPGLVDEGKADDSMTDPQSITTTNLDEAVEALGFVPVMPQWIPDGWELLPYYASKTASSERFVATYAHDEQDYNLVYQTVYYYDAERASAAFEQNRTGEEIDLANGKTVYISENFNDTTCVWYESLACYSLAGPENTDTIIKIIESIKETP